MGWAEEEVGAAELGDVWLSRRLVERLAGQSSASVPAACSGAAEAKAAYRLLAHEAVGWRDILAPHVAGSARRMDSEPAVPCLQATSEPGCDGQAVGELGLLSHEARRGMHLRAMYAVTPARVPLGMLDAWVCTREAK